MWSSPPGKVGRPEKETLQGAGVGRGLVTCGWVAWQERPGVLGARLLRDRALSQVAPLHLPFRALSLHCGEVGGAVEGEPGAPTQVKADWSSTVPGAALHVRTSSCYMFSCL